MRVAMLTSLLFFAASAAADVQFTHFTWKADNAIEVGFSRNGKATAVRGVLKDGETVEMPGEPVAVTAISFSSSFVALAFVEAGVETGVVVILERQNSQYVPLTASIKGRASTLVADLQGAVAGLNKMNRWDHSLALRSMVSYFAENSAKNLGDFYDAVELGHIKMVSRPEPKGAPGKTAKRAPPPAKSWTAEVVPEPPVAETGWEPKVKRERRRESLPEGFIPPRDAAPKRGNFQPYPGQNIPARAQSDPPRRRPRTMFDLLFGN